jgi:hypothetical protein
MADALVSLAVVDPLGNGSLKRHRLNEDKFAVYFQTI